MAKLNAYITFTGNCREAMSFYKDCLGGELTLNIVGDSPMASQMGPEMKDKILHSMLQSGEMVIMASDMIIPGTRTQGNNVSLCISGTGVENLKTYFLKLSAGGKVNHELKEEFFGMYGDLTDKFGIQWMFQADKK